MTRTARTPKPLDTTVIPNAEPIDFAAWCDRYVAAVARLAEQDLQRQRAA